MAELVDAVDLKSIDPRSCRFDPGRRYFLKRIGLLDGGHIFIDWTRAGESL